MPHNKDKIRVSKEEGDLKCRCGKRAIWWILTYSVRYPNKGKWKDVTRKVGPYCAECTKLREFQ